MGGEIDDDLSLEVVTSSLKLLPRIYRMPLDTSELSTHLRFFEKIVLEELETSGIQGSSESGLGFSAFSFREELPRNRPSLRGLSSE